MTAGPAFASLLSIVLLVSFWLWMFRDMSANAGALPPCFVSVTDGRDQRRDWTFAFVALNLLAAAVYFAKVYRNR